MVHKKSSPITSPQSPLYPLVSNPLDDIFIARD